METQFFCHPNNEKFENGGRGRHIKFIMKSAHGMSYRLLSGYFSISMSTIKQKSTNKKKMDGGVLIDES